MCPLPPAFIAGSIAVMAQLSNVVVVNVAIAANNKSKLPTISEEEEEPIPRIKSRGSTSSSDSSCSVVSDSEALLSSLDEIIVDRLGRAVEVIARQGDLRTSSATNSVVAGKRFVGPSGRIPSMSVSAYLRRMLKYIDQGQGSSSWTSLSTGVKALISAIVYIDRIATHAELEINSFRIHRLLACGILVALKMNEDALINTGMFAMLAGVTSTEMKKLESEFVSLLKWDLVISEADFSARVKSFERLCASNSNKKPNKKKSFTTMSMESQHPNSPAVASS
jgi:hypothetical protein